MWRQTPMLGFEKWIACMTEITASTLLAEMKPAWRAALGDRVSHEYVEGFARRNRVRLEAALAPLAAAMNAGPAVHVAEPAPQSEARDKARTTRLRSAATNLAHRRVQVAADSIAKLRHQDVERVLRETPADERRQVAYVLADLRPELSAEIDEVMREVLGEPGSWSEYGRQEIYEPGARARREATLAEDAAEKAAEDFRRGNFGALGQGAPLPEPTRSEEAFERALEAAAPMIAEAEREIAAATGEPRPVVMASLEAGGILLLSPLGFLGRDLFQTYRDATSKLQYVSYPKKGQRGIPKVVARAVLALERDGFEVRAEDPEVVKSLIVTGGLDHAIAVGPPPPRAPREAPDRPPTRTADPDLIARVNAMAEDPPTSTLKYLVKTLHERGDLPLQVKDWKEGGWRPVETAIEEAEGKAARKLARKPKAERLRADGVERPAKDANEEHAAQALVQLANMDPDKARQVNDAGFSKSDVATGHALARRWEATGELTGDEWEWAVAVANKYRRQVGPLPEPKGKAKRQQSEARTIDMGNNESLSMGVFEDTDGTFYAMTFSQSKDGFKTRAGAERWLARHMSPDQQSTVKPETVDDRLFVGVMPTGIVYADRSREVDGDYARCAFLPFDTLALEIAPKCPKDMLGAIKADAATIIARRGEQFKISASDQTVVLGGRNTESPNSKSARNDAIDRWHDDDSDKRTLHDALGMTRDEYIRWAEGHTMPQPYLLFRGPDGHEAHSVSDLVPLLEAEFGPDAMTTASAMPGSDPVADLGRWYAREHGLEYLGPEQFGFRMHPWPSLEAERSHLERVAPQAAMALANLPGPERQHTPPDPYWAEREAEHQQEKYRAAQRQADADAGSRSLRRSERSARLAEAEASLSHYASELKLDPTNEHTRKQVKFYRSLIRGLSKPIRERP